MVVVCLEVAASSRLGAHICGKDAFVLQCASALRLEGMILAAILLGVGMIK